ncbi:MAG: YqaE/Pmp3 family membrane protein [Methylobacteriaceae bacterium]|nr:YqaE/Pmp3 family membrane protein [Methylobacteriaceae bacterium]
MIYAVAVLLPWLALMLRGRMIQGLLCLILQITLIGWIPALIWAIVVINNDNEERRHREMMDAVRHRA